MSKIRWYYVWGAFFTLVFFSLLTIRLGIFQKNHDPMPMVPVTAGERSSESWMNIYQNNKKIGVSHRTFSVRDKGFSIGENVSMQINTMGVTQVLNISTNSDLNTDMTVSSFNFDITSSLFRFNAHGFVVKNRLMLFTGLPGAQQKIEIPLKEIPRISGNIYDAAFRLSLEKDMTHIFSIFDPSTLSLRSIQVTRHADEIISIMGKRILAKKYCADFMGAQNCAWLGNNGDTLKETGILGLSLEKVSPEKAKEGISKEDKIDFTQVASIPANVIIDNPQKLSRIKIQIGAVRNIPLHLHGDRQNFRNDVLTIIREQPSALQPAGNDIPRDVAVFLQATPLVQANHPDIKAQVDKIVDPSDSPEQKAKKIVDWVYRHIEKKPVLSVPNALEVLLNKAGDCNEHAVLVAAFLRTAGIPAQIESGLVYLSGRFYYHAWNSVYLGKWITADAIFNQFPTDVTHIRLIRGEANKQLDLIGVMGKIKLEILERQ
ncbi:MAG: transglutaminase-like domain-containing protein [Smithella sp.]